MNCTICGEEIEETKVTCRRCKGTGIEPLRPKKIPFKMRAFYPKKRESDACVNCKGTGIFIHTFEVSKHYKEKHPDLEKFLGEVVRTHTPRRPFF